MICKEIKTIMATIIKDSSTRLTTEMEKFTMIAEITHCN